MITLKALLKLKIFWVLLFMILAVTFGIIYASTNIVIFAKLAIISMVVPILFGFIMLIYAWIINPIKSLIDKD